MVTVPATLSNVFYRPESSPEDHSSFQNAFGKRQQEYRLLWHYYQNSVFRRVRETNWYGYKRAYGLYRSTRSVYNPTRRLADFYAGKIYPGVLPLSDDKLPPGISVAIPLNEGIDTNLRKAIRQLWQWTNWQDGKTLMVRFGAVAGDVLVEVIDDIDRGKIFFNIVWSAWVRNVVLDIAGNVREYAVEYPATDIDGKQYLYKKIVSKNTIEEFKNGIAFDYGQGTIYPNPYGFVPAAWIRHRNLGTVWGGSVIYGAIEKIDELNALASHVHDQIHRAIAAPIVLWTESNITDALPAPKADQTASDYAFEGDGIDRDDLLILKGLPGGSVDSLIGGLDLGDALLQLKELKTEVEEDFPELIMYRELRGMTQVTGPAAQRLVGDVENNVVSAAAGYDQATIKLFQMAVAIAGWRLAEGVWAENGIEITPQHEMFRDFNLDSYKKGDLDFWIEPRPLIPLSESEKLEGEMARVNLELMELKLKQAKEAPNPMMGTAGVDATPQATAFNAQQQQDGKAPAEKPKDESKNTNPGG